MAADVVSQVLIDLGLKTDASKRALKEIYDILDERDRRELAIDASNQKSQQQLLSQTKDALKFEQLLNAEREKVTEFLQENAETILKELKMEEERLAVQREITREMSKQLNLKFEETGDPSRSVPPQRPIQGRLAFSGGGIGQTPTPALPPPPAGGGTGGFGGGIVQSLSAGALGALGGIAAGIATQGISMLTGAISNLGRSIVEAANDVGPLLNQLKG